MGKIFVILSIFIFAIGCKLDNNQPCGIYERQVCFTGGRGLERLEFCSSNKIVDKEYTYENGTLSLNKTGFGFWRQTGPNVIIQIDSIVPNSNGTVILNKESSRLFLKACKNEYKLLAKCIESDVVVWDEYHRIDQ